MGAVELYRIPVWTDDYETDPDASVPIGSLNAINDITLTKVVERGVWDQARSRGGIVLDFDEEEGGFWVCRAKPIEIRNPSTPLPRAIRLITIEVATDKHMWQKSDVVVSWHPPSCDWYGSAELKSVTHRPAQKIELLLKAADEAIASRETAAWAAMTKMKTDPFGSQRMYYARFRELDRIDSGQEEDTYNYADDGRDTATGSKSNRKAQEPTISFGLCDLARCRKILETSELLLETRDKATGGTAIGFKGKEYQVSSIAHSLIREVMSSAIVKALAGPTPQQRTGLEKSPLPAKNGSVATLTQWIFYEDLSRIHKRTLDSGIWREEVIDPKKVGGAKSTTGPSYSRSEIERKIQASKAQLEKNKAMIHRGSWNPLRARLEREVYDPPPPESESSTRAEVEDAILYSAALACFIEMPQNVISILEELRSRYGRFVEAALGTDVSETDDED